MRDEDLLAVLRRLKVQTGSLVCLGCGREHDCGIHGCAILRETIAFVEKKLAEGCGGEGGDGVMERLTKRIDGVVVYVGTRNPYSTGQIPCEVDSAGVRGMMYRLAAYEDTGLEPESVEALKLSMMGKAISEITEFNGLPIDRLRELAEADKDGRVAVLPVGTGGAMLDTSYPENPRLIKRLHFAVAYVSKGIVFHKPYNIFLENIAAGYISPVSKEAEKALEAMTDG